MQQVRNIQEIETAINNNGEMVVLKKSKNNLFIMSMEEYNKKMMKKKIIKNLKQSEKEIANGEGIDSDVAFKELRLKYGY